MVNSDNARFAMTSLLEVNEDNVKVKLKDRPDAGKKLITKEEIEGIEVKLQQQKPAGTNT